MSAAVSSGPDALVGAREVEKMSRKRRTPLLIGALAAVALGISAGYYLLHLGRESTDDAQVEGRLMNVSTRIAGQVLRMNVEDNQMVNEGDVLVELDPADYRAKAQIASADLSAAEAAVEQARSALALIEKTAPAGLTQAQGGLATANASVDAARATLEEARAAVSAAESRSKLSQLNFDREQQLERGGAVAVAALDATRTELDEAEASRERAVARLRAAEASLTGSSGGVALARGRVTAAATESEQISAAKANLGLALARAEQARATLSLAELNVGYTVVRAPHRGVVSRRGVEVGQTVAPERPLLAIVPLDDVWIVANFKEDQLAGVRPGQRAAVHVDTFGGRDFSGHVESIAGGTGARFALLPPDNATGNFVKVVQRVPVLVRLDGASVQLRPGMSADVTIWTK